MQFHIETPDADNDGYQVWMREPAFLTPDQIVHIEALGGEVDGVEGEDDFHFINIEDEMAMNAIKTFLENN